MKKTAISLMLVLTMLVALVLLISPKADAVQEVDYLDSGLPHSGEGVTFIEAIAAEEEEAKDQRRQYGDIQQDAPQQRQGKNGDGNEL